MSVPHESLSTTQLQNDVACGTQLFSFLSTSAQETLSALDPCAQRIAAMNLTDTVRTMVMDIEQHGPDALPDMGPLPKEFVREAKRGLKILRIADMNLELQASHRFILQFFHYASLYGRSPVGGIPPKRRLNDPAPRQMHVTIRLDRKPRRPSHNLQSERTAILFSKLKWFTWHAGRYLDGTITDQGETDSGNVICFIRDDEGTAVKVFIAFPCLAMMRVGGRVRVLDPYLRVDSAGEVTLRVDCRCDFKMLPRGAAIVPPTSGSLRLAEAKSKGDGHLRTKSFDDALRVYMGFLRDETETDDVSLIATLLNNISQCLLNTGAYHEALVAAAWVLFLRPDNAKALGRYNTALARWTTTAADDNNNAALLTFHGSIPSIVAPVAPAQGATRTETTTFDDRLRHKDAGNAHFSEERWGEALDCYCTALHGYDTFGSLLSNLALTLFECRQWIPILCVAPMAAYFNAKVCEKNTSRYIFALLQLQCRNEAERLLTGVEASGDIHQRAAQIIREKYERAVPGLMEAQHDCMVPMVLQQIHGKGRGLVATQDIQPGDVVLLEHAIGTWCGQGDEPYVPPAMPGGSNRIVSERFHYGRSVLVPSERHTFRFLEQRATNLPFPSALLHMLYLLCDVEPSSQTLPNGAPLDLAAYLDGWRQRPFADPYPALSLDIGRICEIITMNSFPIDEFNAERDSNGLFAVASLINHDAFPNAVRLTFADKLMCRAVRRIPAGTEVTMAYYSLERGALEPALAADWGIPEHAAYPDDSTRALVEALVRKIHAHVEVFQTRGLAPEQVAQLAEVFQDVYEHPAIPMPWKVNLLGAVMSMRAIHTPLELLPEAPLYVELVERTGACLNQWALQVMASRVNQLRMTHVPMVPGGLVERIARLVGIHVGNPPA